MAVRDHDIITGIDHILVLAHELPTLASLFQRLGFTLTPQGWHEEWGTINHCVMFPQSYVELIAIRGTGIGASKSAELLAAKGDGLMGVVFGLPDADKGVTALHSRGIAAQRLARLHRQMDTPDGPKTAQTDVVVMPPETLPGLFAAFVQQLTPELTRSPTWLAHPNGAHSLLSATVVVENPIAQIQVYDRLFGPASSTPTDDMVTVRTGNGLLFLVTADDFDHLHPDLDIDLDRTPGLAALTIGVADINKTAEVLKANGVRFRHRGEQIAIAAAESCGIGLELVQA